MTVALIILAALVVVGGGLYIHHRLTAPVVESPPQEAESEECCGLHLSCDKQSLLAGADEPEYFDDEELDRFAGRAPESYTDDEVEEFRDVLLTLLPADIAPWARSIQRRGITLPAPVRDELLLIVSEARRPT